MAWSYNASLSADKDKVRFLVGDTDANDPLIQDEELVFQIIENPNLYRAAATVCRAISARLTRELTLVGSAGSIELDAQKQAERFLALATKYDGLAVAKGGAGVFAGGISRSDKTTRAGDTDRVRPGFRVNLHRTPAIGSTASRVDDTVDES